MRNLFIPLTILLISSCGCSKAEAQLEIVEAFPNLSFEAPVDIQHPGDGTNRLFVVSQPGTIYFFENSSNVNSKKTFLDIRSKVLYGGEQGLLGLAFHPDFKNNGYFFIDYTTSNPRRTIVSRFSVDKNNPDLADPNSELILLEIDQPYSNHNGGQISFGADGYLYISMGDGGSGGDPQNNAQNLRSLLGKILRIDVNNKSGNLNYSIPSDNPFAGNTSGNREEIFAFGLRNVWRFSFDKTTGRLWAADVGQNAWEEINIIEKGKNYGWRIVEGNHCFIPATGCNTNGLTPPIWEYGHNQQGGYSITGGFVYRGNNANEMRGKYIYGDYVTGNIWALDYNGSSASNSLIAPTNHSISTFGVDQNNELYFANYVSGRIYKFKGTPTTKVGSIYLPQKFKLEQNYPNPFNPSTLISYYMPAAGFVTLKIYDILGKEIATLVNESKSAGQQSVEFRSDKYSLNKSRGNSSISSNVYIYALQINTNDYSNYYASKKMIFLK